MTEAGRPWRSLSVGEAQLRAILDAIPARVALLDRERRHCYVNREYAEFLGLAPDAVLGRTVAEVIGEAAYAQLKPYGERALAGEASRWEGWLPYRGQGEPRFVQRFYIPLRGPQGAVDGYFVLARDLTDLKRSERRLAEQLAAQRASEALNTAVIASALDCVVVIDEAGRVVEFNAAAERTFGHARDAALGRPIAELIVPPAMRARHAAGFRRHLETGGGTMLGRRVEVEAMRADGTTFPIELAITEVRLADRRLFTAYLRDLTALKRREAELATRTAQLEAILAGIADGVTIADAEERLVMCNEGFVSMFDMPEALVRPGVPREDFVRYRLSRGILYPGERAGDAPDRLVAGRTGQVRAAGGVMTEDIEVLGRHLHVRRRDLPDGTSVSTFTDFTARVEAERVRERQREALLQAEKMAAFGSLLAGVAHELNNPLSIVLGGALMLREDAEDAAAPALAEQAERIRVAAERCARIVRSFLAMARQQAAERRPVAVAPVVDGVLELLAYGLRSGGIGVERDVPAGLPRVLGDADQLHQILANLVANARQALEHRPEPRRLRIAARTAGAAVEVSVADNGPGIPAEVRGRIFDPFFTTKPVGAGTGIGLAVSRGIAEAHGGSLTLADAAEEEGGARFVLRLPRAGHGAAAPAEGGPDPVPPAAPSAAAAPRTALVVDDEAEVAGLLARVLAALGFRCDLASTGREAQGLLSDRDYDAILCDLRMPDLDGEAFYGWLERNRPRLCARTAFVTGDALGHAASAFLARSGRPVLEKPFAPEEVHRLVAALPAG